MIVTKDTQRKRKKEYKFVKINVTKISYKPITGEIKTQQNISAKPISDTKLINKPSSKKIIKRTRNNSSIRITSKKTIKQSTNNLYNISNKRLTKRIKRNNT